MAASPHDFWNRKMTPVEQLLLERELHEVVCRYAQLCDERDWALMDQIFAPNATANYGGWALPDCAAILRMLQQNLGGCGPTQHLLGNLTVKVDANSVTSQTSIRASHRGAGSMQHETYECMGYYRDTWQQTPAGWRISHRGMVVNFEFGSRKVLGPKIESS